jgi:hypothetical protein
MEDNGSVSASTITWKDIEKADQNNGRGISCTLQEGQ